MDAFLKISYRSPKWHLGIQNSRKTIARSLFVNSANQQIIQNSHAFATAMDDHGLPYTLA